MEDAFAFARDVGYPVLVRPSYVLSGAAMNVAHSEAALGAMLRSAVSVSPEHPVVVTKFEEGAQEVEFDGVAQNGEVVAMAVSEHVEEAGVHSGDATLMLPPQTLSPYYVAQVKAIAAKTARALKISGPFNMQFLAKRGDVSVIECNLRASRSLPFVSKTVGCDFVQAATMVMLGVDVRADKSLNLPALDSAPRPANFVGIKAPMFSFTRLRGADPVLGVEMASTGEVACFGASKHEAFLKSLVATNFELPKAGGTVLLSAQAQFRAELVHSAFLLQRLGFALLATPGTHDFLAQRGIAVGAIDFAAGLSDVKQGRVELVINLSNPQNGDAREANALVRRAAVDHAVPLMTNPKLVAMLAESLDAHATRPMVGLLPGALADFYRAEKDTDAWTSKNEFH
jgi:carbamoyl-phosphate synthase (ammonia)